MARKNKIYLTLGFLLILLVTFYLSLPDILRLTTEKILTRNGFTNIHAIYGQPGLNSLAIKSLSFETKQAGQYIQTSLSNIRIQYDLAGLISKKIGSVKVSESLMRVRPDSKSRKPAPLKITLSDKLPSQWMNKIPVKKLEITNSVIEWHRNQQEKYRLVSSLSITPENIQLKGRAITPHFEPVRLQFRLQNDNTIQVLINLIDNDPLMNFQVTSTKLKKGKVILAGTSDTSLKTLNKLKSLLPQIKLTKLPDSGTIKNQWKLQLPGTLPATPSEVLQQIEVHSTQQVTLEREAQKNIERLRSRFILDSHYKHNTLSWKLHPGASLKTRGMSIHTPAPANGRIHLTGNTLDLQLEQGAILQVTSSASKNLYLPAQTLRTITPIDMIYNRKTMKWSGKPLSIDVAPQKISWNKNHVKLGRITIRLTHLSGSNKDWKIKGNFYTENIHSEIFKQAFPATNLKTQFQLSPVKFNAASKITAEQNKLVLDAYSNFYPRKRTGLITLRLQPVKMGTDGLNPAKFIQQWPRLLTLTEGNIKADAIVGINLKRKQPITRQIANIHLQNISGKHDQVHFEKVETSLSIKDFLSPQSIKTSTLTIQSINPGLPIRNIRTRYKIRKALPGKLPLLQILTSSADLLGGSVHFEPFTLDLSGETNKVNVILKKISLKEILDLEKQKGLHGTGFLDGRIPLTFSQKKAFVKNGKIYARPPGGIIRYQPDQKVSALAKTNPAIKLLTDALTDYRYNKLDITANYEPSGDLLLKVSLKGKNPGWQSGRPVHLNLNLEENIPTLLKSLQLDQDINQKIRKGIGKQ